MKVYLSQLYLAKAKVNSSTLSARRFLSSNLTQGAPKFFS